MQIITTRYGSEFSLLYLKPVAVTIISTLGAFVLQKFGTFIQEKSFNKNFCPNARIVRSFQFIVNATGASFINYSLGNKLPHFLPIALAAIPILAEMNTQYKIQKNLNDFLLELTNFREKIDRTTETIKKTNILTRYDEIDALSKETLTEAAQFLEGISFYNCVVKWQEKKNLKQIGNCLSLLKRELDNSLKQLEALPKPLLKKTREEINQSKDKIAARSQNKGDQGDAFKAMQENQKIDEDYLNVEEKIKTQREHAAHTDKLLEKLNQCAETYHNEIKKKYNDLTEEFLKISNFSTLEAVNKSLVLALPEEPINNITQMNSFTFDIKIKSLTENCNLVVCPIEKNNQLKNISILIGYWKLFHFFDSYTSTHEKLDGLIEKILAKKNEIKKEKKSLVDKNQNKTNKAIKEVKTLWENVVNRNVGSKSSKKVLEENLLNPLDEERCQEILEEITTLKQTTPDEHEERKALSNRFQTLLTNHKNASNNLYKKSAEASESLETSYKSLISQELLCTTEDKMEKEKKFFSYFPYVDKQSTSPFSSWMQRIQNMENPQKNDEITALLYRRAHYHLASLKKITSDL